MVWQLEGGGEPNPSSLSRPSPHHSLSSSSLSMRGVSLGSSSIDLGPTPGSGVGLDSPVQSFLESDSETETLNLNNSSVPFKKRFCVEDSEIETGTDPLQWSREVESMINNPPLQTFQSFKLEADPSLSSWILPQDQYNHLEEEHHREQPFSILQSNPSSSDPQGSRLESNESPGGAKHSSSRTSINSEPLEDFTQQPSKI